MTSFWKQLAICCALIVGAAAIWQYRADLTQLVNASPAAPSPERRDRAEGTPVIVAAAEMVRDDRTVSVLGTGFAERSVILRAPSGGEITGLNVAPGRRFSEGELLMQLEDADERFAVSLAQVRFDRASDERERYLRLEDRGVAAAARLEEIQTDYQVARIELERALEDLEKRALRAPFDGITGLANVEVGDRITTDEPIGSFDDRSRILVEFDLPEALLSRISAGLGVIATTPSVEGRSFDAEISAIDSRVDAATRTARVRASIDNSADLLRPGASFALTVKLPGQSFPAVPELALQFAEGALHVWRVVDGVAEQVPVRLVRRRAGQVIVDAPLQEGDPIVVEGTQRLRSGSAVHVLNAPEEPQT
jgi:RND family efflux transporter MFP subunit